MRTKIGMSVLALGADGMNMGTRFIATTECTAHEDYKRAILEAEEEDIVITRHGKPAGNRCSDRPKHAPARP